MALGARRSRVVSQVLTQTMLIAAAGTIVGVVAALMATKTLNTFLFGLSDHDPATLDPVQAIKAE